MKESVKMHHALNESKSSTPLALSAEGVPDVLDDVTTAFGALDDDGAEEPIAPVALEDAEEEAPPPVPVEGAAPGADPVRLYLRQMGATALLTREGEVEIAKRIEGGETEMM